MNCCSPLCYTVQQSYKIRQVHRKISIMNKKSTRPNVLEKRKSCGVGPIILNLTVFKERILIWVFIYSKKLVLTEYELYKGRSQATLLFILHI